MTTAKATSTWRGSWKHGEGRIATASPTLDAPFSFASRFADAPGASPEERRARPHALQHREGSEGANRRAIDQYRYVADRSAWIWATTAAPSPTAAATRFVEPARTSPIANTPGTLVASDRSL